MAKKSSRESTPEPFRLEFTAEARDTLPAIEPKSPKKYKKILKTFGHLQNNPRHPGLNSHRYESLEGPEKEPVFESYVENRTPGAYRVFWYYGPGVRAITIVAITPHP